MMKNRYKWTLDEEGEPIKQSWGNKSIITGVEIDTGHKKALWVTVFRGDGKHFSNTSYYGLNTPSRLKRARAMQDAVIQRYNLLDA